MIFLCHVCGGLHQDVKKEAFGWCRRCKAWTGTPEHCDYHSKSRPAFREVELPAKEPRKKPLRRAS